MKRFLALALALVMVVSMAACSSNTPAPATEKPKDSGAGATQAAQPQEAEKKTVKIGVTNCSDTDTFTKLVADTLKEMIEKKHPDWDATFVGAEMDSSIQIAQTETFIAAGCNYICLSSADTEGSTPCLDLCLQNNIPFINYVNPVSGDEKTYTFVGGDNPTCGYDIAKFAADKLPQNAKVCIMEGDPGAQNGLIRRDGLVKGLKELRPDVEVIASQTAYWSREDGMSLMEDWLEAYGEDGIDAVFCMNDNMALGAVEAIKAHNIENGKIMVTGCDGTEDAWQYIKEGSMTMSMFYNHVAQATGVLTILEKLVDNGASAADWIYTNFEVVDSSNVEQYLAEYYGK